MHYGTGKYLIWWAVGGIWYFMINNFMLNIDVECLYAFQRFYFNFFGEYFIFMYFPSCFCAGTLQFTGLGRGQNVI